MKSNNQKVAHVSAVSPVGFGVSEFGAGVEVGLGVGKWDVAVLLIQRPKEIIVTPGQGQKIEEGDVLVLAGEDDKMERFLAETRKKRAEKQPKEKG